MVKTLHALDAISARIGQGGGRRVCLWRDGDNDEAVEGVPTDVAAAVIHALAEPLELPPLADATVPGDRVAITVDSAVPCAAEIVRGAVEAAASAGVDRDAISIVSTSAELVELCRAKLADNDTDDVPFVIHDPDDEQSLCLVGVTERREPLLLNRTIFDADLVAPIGCARLGGCGVFDSLFPRFSSAAAVERFRTPASYVSPAARAAQSRETDAAGWLIGVPLVINVVPGPGGAVAHVVAGEPRAVARRSEQLCRRQWSLRSPRRAGLVVATVTGGPLAQTWQNVARALAAAERLVDADGAVAICSNLDRPLGESLGRLVGSSDFSVAERELLHDHAEDSRAAWHLARALARGPVYFLSQLDAETAEDIGLAPVADVAELVRLAGRQESCIVLDDAQHAVATVEGEPADV